MGSRDDVSETRAYDLHSVLSLRFLGDGRGLFAGALPVFRAGQMERQSVVVSGYSQGCFVLPVTKCTSTKMHRTLIVRIVHGLQFSPYQEIHSGFP